MSVFFIHTKVNIGGCARTCTMKLYVCQSCDAVSRSDLDAQHHSRSNAHANYREYELEDFLTRFLAQA
jgi:hypothetical protein